LQDDKNIYFIEYNRYVEDLKALEKISDQIQRWNKAMYKRDARKSTNIKAIEDVVLAISPTRL